MLNRLYSDMSGREIKLRPTVSKHATIFSISISTNFSFRTQFVFPQLETRTIWNPFPASSCNSLTHSLKA